VPRSLILFIAALGLVAVPASASAAVVIERQGTTLVATGTEIDEGFGVTVWNTETGPMYAFVPNTAELGPHGTVLEPDSGCAEPEAEVEAVLCDMTGVTAVVVDAGRGDDAFFASGVTVPVTVTCGAGLDSVQGTTSVAADCEGSPRKVTRLMNARALAASAGPFKRARLGTLLSGGVPLDVVPMSDGTLKAVLSATVKGKRRVIGTATKSGGPISVTLRLSKAGRALAKDASRLKVRLDLRLSVPGRQTVTYAANSTAS
jgi:hypothetical protein